MSKVVSEGEKRWTMGAIRVSTAQQACENRHEDAGEEEIRN